MNNARRLEQLLATILRYGTWFASALIGLGSALAIIDSRLDTHDLAIVPNMRIAAAGIGIFILLPILRVALMLLMFLREGEVPFAIAAGIVLAIILLAFIVGFRATGGRPTQQRKEFGSTTSYPSPWHGWLVGWRVKLWNSETGGLENATVIRKSL